MSAPPAVVQRTISAETGGGCGSDPPAEEPTTDRPTLAGPPLHAKAAGDSTRQVLRVLYLFAGPKRKSSLASALQQACKSTGVKVDVKEYDILQGGKNHDLTNKKRQAGLLRRVRGGEFFMSRIGVW